MPGTRSVPCAARDTRLADTGGATARPSPGRRADAVGGTAPDTGFRGLAAGFQPGLKPFLARHAPTLTGLSVMQSARDLRIGAAEGRPDYIVLSDPDDPAGLLVDLVAAARRPALGMLFSGPAEPLAGAWPAAAVVDHVEPREPPFEVALALRALMRRCRPQAMVGAVSHGDLVLDEAELRFSIRDAAVPLTLEVFGVLGAMMDDPGRVWDRAQLHALVFGRASTNDIRAIDMRISRARRHVAAALGRDPIRTVRGIGYALVPDP